MRIEIGCDRAPERRRRDPVVAREGVFAALKPDELSPAEAARPAQAEAAAQARARRPRRLWLAADMLKSLTRIYGRFSNPFRPAAAAGTRHETGRKSPNRSKT